MANWKVWLRAFVITLGVLEGGSRLLVRDPAPTTLSGFVIPDRDLIWRLKPSGAGPLATNELGLRDGPYDSEADFRILLLGDSVSWGDRVAMRQAYPYRLERLLNERARPRTVEVVNSGVPGYSTFQQLKYLELDGLALQPDAIVLQFCLNDFVERYSALAEYGGENLFLGIDTRGAVSGVHGFLLRHSRFYEWLARSIVRIARRRQEYDVRELSKDPLSPALQEAWDRTISELEGIAGLAAAHRIPFLLVIAPYAYQLEDPAGTGAPQRRLIEFAASRGLGAFDLLPVFAAQHQHSRHPALFLDENHFSPTGHRLAADALVEPFWQLRREPGKVPADLGAGRRRATAE